MTALSRNNRGGPPIVGISHNCSGTGCPGDTNAPTRVQTCVPSPEKPTLVTSSLSNSGVRPLVRLTKSPLPT